MRFSKRLKISGSEIFTHHKNGISFWNLLYTTAYRMMATSMAHGLFVAPSTRTLSLSVPTLCISVMSAFLIRRVVSLSSSDRAEDSPSTFRFQFIDLDR